MTGDDTSGSLVGLSFDDAFRAQEFLLAAKSLDAGGQLKLNDAVVVVKNTEEGHIDMADLEENVVGGALAAGAIDGTQYAVPLMINVKSIVYFCVCCGIDCSIQSFKEASKIGIDISRAAFNVHRLVLSGVF